MATLGSLQLIEFLERDTLFWHKHHGYRAVINGENCSISTSSTNKEDIIVKADSHFDGADEGLGCGLCLGLQFTRVLVILQFHDGLTKKYPFLQCFVLSEGQCPHSAVEKTSTISTPQHWLWCWSPTLLWYMYVLG